MLRNFINQLLKVLIIMANFSIEDQYSNYVLVGLDEVGRGAWAGPIVVGAVIINRNFDCTRIHDSKTLSKPNLLKFSREILTRHICSIGVSDIEEINQSNINQATVSAMLRAIDGLPVKPNMALVDGNIKLDGDIKTLNVIKGDSISVSIAAASIIAKVYRDNYMAKLAIEFPDYLWAKNVGYGTQKHLEGIISYGVSLHHRVNYKPIQKILSQS
jgi:ribonuclease HII